MIETVYTIVQQHSVMTQARCPYNVCNRDAWCVSCFTITCCTSALMSVAIFLRLLAFKRHVNQLEPPCTDYGTVRRRRTFRMPSSIPSLHSMYTMMLGVTGTLLNDTLKKIHRVSVQRLLRM